MKRIIITVLAIMFLTGCAVLDYIEQPQDYRDGHFQKYDQRMMERETGNNQ